VPIRFAIHSLSSDLVPFVQLPSDDSLKKEFMLECECGAKYKFQGSRKNLEEYLSSQIWMCGLGRHARSPEGACKGLTRRRRRNRDYKGASAPFFTCYTCSI